MIKDTKIDVERFKKVMRENARREEERYQTKWKTQFLELKKIFPDITFFYNNFTFKHPKSGLDVSISKLLGHPFFKPSDSELKKFTTTRYIVNALINQQNHVKHLYSEHFWDEIFSQIHNSTLLRGINKGFYKKFYEASDSIEGIYKIKDTNLFVKISNDPVDILMKSTGVPWSSCENITGDFSEGISSDIEWGNLVAFVFEDKGDYPLARVMIRLCETDEDEVSFGIEPYWYTYFGRTADKRKVIAEGVEISDVLKLILKVIESKGFDMKYSSCTTPYEYQGFSDKMDGGETEITYTGEKNEVDMEYVIETCTRRGTGLVDFSKCPFCGVIQTWKFDFETSEKLDFSRDGNRIYNNFYITDYFSVVKVKKGYVLMSDSGFNQCPKCGRNRIEFRWFETDGTLKDFHELNVQQQAEILSQIPEFENLFKYFVIVENKEFHSYIETTNREKEFMQFFLAYELNRTALRLHVTKVWRGKLYDRYALSYDQKIFTDIDTVIKKFVSERVPSTKTCVTK